MKLPARLLSAWRHTHYTMGTIDVMINRRSSEMDKLLTAYRVRSAVFVTAWNPLSHRMPVRWNQRSRID